jgi:hypothetical protein
VAPNTAPEARSKCPLDAPCRCPQSPVCGDLDLADEQLAQPLGQHFLAGSAASMSMGFLRLAGPRTKVTDRWGTPNVSAITASAERVAFPPSAGEVTRTTSAPSCVPPTTVREAFGRT